MLPLPMLAFKLKDMDDFMELTIEEVFGYPDETSYPGGYSARGKISIQVDDFSVQNATVYFSTGELYQFMMQLQNCYDRLDGAALLENSEYQLEMKCEFNKRGHVLIRGRIKSYSGFDNIFAFEFETDQTHIPSVLSALKAVAAIFGDNMGVKGKNHHPSL